MGVNNAVPPPCGLPLALTIWLGLGFSQNFIVAELALVLP
jgi:hypothetical protein